MSEDLTELLSPKQRDLNRQMAALEAKKAGLGKGSEKKLSEIEAKLRMLRQQYNEPPKFNREDIALLPPPPRRDFRASSVTIGPCGKHTFESERQCKDAIRHRLNKGANVNKLIAYFCRDCHGWHMTSRDSRKDH